MKNLFLFLLLPALYAGNAVAQNTAKQSATDVAKSNGFLITGNVQGLGDVEVKLLSADGQPYATTQAKAGLFVLKGSVAQAGLYQLVLGNQKPRYVFLENLPFRVAGTLADSKTLKIEGGAAQKDFTVFEQTFNPLFAALNTAVTNVNNASEAKKPALMKQYSAALNTVQTELVKFLSARSNSPVALFAVSVTMQAAETIVDVEKRFNLLSETLRNSAAGKDIASYIAQAKIGAIGTDAVDFTQNDVNDKPVTLSSFKGKYVLVDFWASWCRPCRAENPNVVKVYNKFKNKNFTVLGVSLDQQKEAWTAAIAKDNLTWTHVSDLQFWNNAAAQLYKVQSIPQNFLIDPAGKIVAKDLRGSDLEKKLCEYLGCSN